ncbi:MAG: hypothetical protein AAF639_12545 [Chloroflexota bacterium]
MSNRTSKLWWVLTGIVIGVVGIGVILGVFVGATTVIGKAENKTVYQSVNELTEQLGFVVVASTYRIPMEVSFNVTETITVPSNNSENAEEGEDGEGGTDDGEGGTDDGEGGVNTEEGVDEIVKISTYTRAFELVLESSTLVNENPSINVNATVNSQDDLNVTLGDIVAFVPNVIVPTPTPTPIAFVARGVITNNTNANTRSGPSTNFIRTGTLPRGSEINIVATNSDESWYQLDDGNWVAAFLVEDIVTEADADESEAEAESTPTPDEAEEADAETETDAEADANEEEPSDAEADANDESANEGDDQTDSASEESASDEADSDEANSDEANTEQVEEEPAADEADPPEEDAVESENAADAAEVDEAVNENESTDVAADDATDEAVSDEAAENTDAGEVAEDEVAEDEVAEDEGEVAEGEVAEEEVAEDVAPADTESDDEQAGDDAAVDNTDEEDAEAKADTDTDTDTDTGTGFDIFDRLATSLLEPVVNTVRGTPSIGTTFEEWEKVYDINQGQVDNIFFYQNGIYGTMLLDERVWYLAQNLVQLGDDKLILGDAEVVAMTTLVPADSVFLNAYLTDENDLVEVLQSKSVAEVFPDIDAEAWLNGEPGTFYVIFRMDEEELVSTIEVYLAGAN